jgi:hypothetical protein
VLCERQTFVRGAEASAAALVLRGGKKTRGAAERRRGSDRDKDVGMAGSNGSRGFVTTSRTTRADDNKLIQMGNLRVDLDRPNSAAERCMEGTEPGFLNKKQVFRDEHLSRPNSPSASPVGPMTRCILL